MQRVQVVRQQAILTAANGCIHTTMQHLDAASETGGAMAAGVRGLPLLLGEMMSPLSKGSGRSEGRSSSQEAG